MCGFVLDALVICVLAGALNNEAETEWLKAGLCGLAISVVTIIITGFLAQFGLVFVLLGLIPSFFFAGLVFHLFFGMPLPRAAVASLAFLGYRIAFSIAVVMMKSTA